MIAVSICSILPGIRSYSFVMYETEIYIIYCLILFPGRGGMFLPGAAKLNFKAYPSHLWLIVFTLFSGFFSFRLSPTFSLFFFW